MSSRTFRPSLQLLTCAFALLAIPDMARADCSVIAPEGFDQRAYLGASTSPFLTPGLTTDIKVVGALCDNLTRSAAPDFQVGGVDQAADDFVITVAFTPASGPRPLLVFGADPTLCGSDPNCTVDTTSDREIALIPLPGGGVERRLRFRYPNVSPAFGPVRLGVRLASDPTPVAAGLRSDGCDTASGSFVACVDLFYRLDGSCRSSLADVNQPFSGLVAIPKTNFTSICTDGCQSVAPGGPTSSTLPVTTDRAGNAMFAMVYADQLVRQNRGMGVIEPLPRRLDFRLSDAVNNGFTDDGGGAVSYDAKPSSFTFEGFPLSPPFNPFVDPTAPVGDVGVWGMADAEATVHFLPKRSCSDNAARACQADSDCATGTCRADEFSLAQTTAAVQLPVASATAKAAVELNSWLNGNLSDAAVVLTEEEAIRGDAINSDGAIDDIVVELLDRGTGLLKTLGGQFEGRGLARVRVRDGDQDFVLPSAAAEGSTIAFLESELAENLSDPLSGTSAAAAAAADENDNGRLDQNLRVFELPSDPSVTAAVSLMDPNLNIAVLPDLHFRGGQNLVLSDRHVFFAYSPLGQQPHGYQLASQSTNGTPANFSAGAADVSPDGRYLAFVSSADNLFVPEPPGALSAETSGGTLLEAVTGPNGEFPVLFEGRSIFEYVVTDDGSGPSPTRAFLELKTCDTAAGQPDLAALVNLALTGPDATIDSMAGDCTRCSFPGSNLVMFSEGVTPGGSRTYTLVLDSVDVPVGEIGMSVRWEDPQEIETVRGPTCIPTAPQGGVARVYLRDTQLGTTEIVSVPNRPSCGTQATASNDPSGNPQVTTGGQLVFFDSAASLTSNDPNGPVEDVYVYDPATCQLVNLSAGQPGPSRNPTSSDDGGVVVYESGASATLVLLDRATMQTIDLGAGENPDLSADGTKLVFTETVAGVSQVFLMDLQAGGAPVAVSVVDGANAPFLTEGGEEPSVANSGDTAFTTPLGATDSDVLVRDPANDDTSLASSLPDGAPLCVSSPCGAFEPSISDDGRFVSFVLRGLAAVDEILVKDLTTGSITPLTRSAGADGDSYGAMLGASGDFVALTSEASSLGGVAGGSGPSVFLEGPLDPTAPAGPFLGVLDLDSCVPGSCVPTLTGEPIEMGSVFQGDAAVVGSPLRLVEVAPGPGGISVRSFTREGSDVALSDEYVCTIATADGAGNPGDFAACGARSGSTLTDLTLGGIPLSAADIGLCGSRAIVLTPGGMLYEADLEQGFAASFVQPAQDFELGDDLDLDGDGDVDSCLVAFRTQEADFGAAASTVGNRDLDTDDLAMYLLDSDGSVTDCGSSATDCPGQACQLFNYQVGSQSVIFIVDELDENFGFSPAQDVCSPGTDVNADGFCSESMRRCSAGGALTAGTTITGGANPFAAGRFPDGENTVTLAGFCGTDLANVRFGQICDDDIDCLALPGETCQGPFVILSALADTDGDEVPDVVDNCPNVPNPDQTNSDQNDPNLIPDAFGDACDALTCGDGIQQSAEACDAGPLNGMPGSDCSVNCAIVCNATFEVTETLKPGSRGSTPIIVHGSAAPDGTGCLNLGSSEVGGVPALSLEPETLRLSATPPGPACPGAGGAPVHELTRSNRYDSHLGDKNGDDIEDLVIHADTLAIGGDASTTELYLTGRFSDSSPFAGTCFQAVAPVEISTK